MYALPTGVWQSLLSGTAYRGRAVAQPCRALCKSRPLLGCRTPCGLHIHRFSFLIHIPSISPLLQLSSHCYVHPSTTLNPLIKLPFHLTSFTLFIYICPLYTNLSICVSHVCSDSLLPSYFSFVVSILLEFVAICTLLKPPSICISKCTLVVCFSFRLFVYKHI